MAKDTEGGSEIVIWDGLTAFQQDEGGSERWVGRNILLWRDP